MQEIDEQDYFLEDEILEDIADPTQDPMYEHHRFVIHKGQKVTRIDKYLANHIEGISRSKIQDAAEANCIFVNDTPVKSNYRVKPLDIIVIKMSKPPRDIEIIPENININVVYEDDQLIVVNKHADIVVHPSFGHYTGTLVNALAYHIKDSELFKPGDIRPGLVHRIDRNTTGLIVIAKTEFAKIHLAKQFFLHTTKRKYVALVWGNFNEPEGTITANVGRNPKNRKNMYVFPNNDQGKHAVTHYKVIENFGYTTLVECVLETGRTHQIRVHMKYAGHTLFNDSEYDGNHILKGTTFTKYKQFVENCFEIIPRQALHAKTLGFIHPTKNIEMIFETELPTDMLTVIEKWRNYAAGRLI